MARKMIEYTYFLQRTFSFDSRGSFVFIDQLRFDFLKHWRCCDLKTMC